jgi:hypothetical protein
MSKNTLNTLKNNKTGHKRNNSNSYNASTISNINQNITTTNSNNQSEITVNTISNIGNQTMNQTMFNINTGVVSGVPGIIGIPLGNTTTFQNTNTLTSNISSSISQNINNGNLLFQNFKILNLSCRR